MNAVDGWILAIIFSMLVVLVGNWISDKLGRPYKFECRVCKLRVAANDRDYIERVKKAHAAKHRLKEV